MHRRMVLKPGASQDMNMLTRSLGRVTEVSMKILHQTFTERHQVMSSPARRCPLVSAFEQ